MACVVYTNHSLQSASLAVGWDHYCSWTQSRSISELLWVTREGEVEHYTSALCGFIKESKRRIPRTCCLMEKISFCFNWNCLHNSSISLMALLFIYCCLIPACKNMTPTLTQISEFLNHWHIMLCTVVWVQDWYTRNILLFCRIWHWNTAGGQAPSSLSWGRRSRSWTLRSTCTWWPGYRHWLDSSNRCRSGDFIETLCVCFFSFYLDPQIVAPNFHAPLLNRYTGIQHLKLSSRSGSEKEKLWGNEDNYFGNQEQF